MNAIRREALIWATLAVVILARLFERAAARCWDAARVLTIRATTPRPDRPAANPEH